MDNVFEISNGRTFQIKDFIDNDTLLKEITNAPEVGHEANRMYCMVINLLTGLDMDEPEASAHYYKIMEHKYLLSEKLERDIGFRVATLDYFFNHLKILKNPKFIEIDLFEKILSMSKEDPKTDCYNASFLKEAVEKELKRAERHNTTFSILILDLDNFKDINDKHGHLFGDKILKKFVAIIKESIRVEDILARYGGDEFIVLSPQTGRIGARSLAERIKHKLHEYFLERDYNGTSLDVTFSGGIATYPYDAPSFDSLIDFADKALYKSKFMGKNRIYDFLEEEFLKDREYNANNKRNFTRYSFAHENRIQISNKDSHVNIKGKIVNISGNGAFLECSCSVSEDIFDQRLNFKLHSVDNKELPSVDFAGNIVRLNKESSRLKFYLAVKFDQVINSDQWNVLENISELIPIP